MTSVRRSVEQTVTRLVTRTLRERAQAAGTPEARPDAPQALATLLDQILPARDPAALPALCAKALAYGFGCIVVPLEHGAACVDRVAGSGMRVGVCLRHDREIDLALDAGVGEIEIAPPASLLRQRAASPRNDDLHNHLVNLRGRASGGIILKLDLTGALSDDALLSACAHAATAGIDLVVIPRHLIADVQRTINPAMGIKVAGVATLEEARRLLADGATRLGTANGHALVDAASAPSK